MKPFFMRHKKPIAWTCLISILLLWAGHAWHLLPDPLSHWLDNLSATMSWHRAQQTMIRTSDFTKLVEQHGAAVVNIQVYHEETNSLRAMLPPAGNRDPMWDFFHRFAPPPDPAEPILSNGSGFMISADGYILTSAHLVRRAGYIKVTCMDKQEFPATLFGLDERTDIALLKIKSQDLPVVKIGRPASLKVGEWVVAIGSPFQLDHTVTAGIISATRRNLPDGSYIPFIQTDVAINAGNSGGPLFNLQGEVIGVNAKIYSRSGEFSGIAFAVPIDIAMHAAEQIKKTGHVQHSKLGIYMQPVTQGIAKAFMLNTSRGMLIAHLETQGPADRAGLKVGDILLSVNQQSITSHSDLFAILSTTLPRQIIRVAIWRKGQTQTIPVTLGQLPDDRVFKRPTLPQPPPMATPSQRLHAMGVVLSPLNDQQKKQLHLPQGGLMVEGITGIATRAGLMLGDVIIGMNRQPIGTLKQLQIALTKSNGNVAFLVQRAENRLFIPFSFDEIDP